MREPYKHAIVKFNNGHGALLCNVCHVIIATGFDHEDRVHLCDKCEKKPKDEIEKT